MKRYKVRKVFQDARTNEIYGAGVLITLTTERADEIIEKLGDEYLEIMPDNPEQVDEVVQAAVDKATAPLLDKIEQLKSQLVATTENQQEEGADQDFPKMISRGHYKLSNGELFEGNKDTAIEAEKALEK